MNVCLWANYTTLAPTPRRPPPLRGPFHTEDHYDGIAKTLLIVYSLEEVLLPKTGEGARECKSNTRSLKAIWFQEREHSTKLGADL